MLRYQRCRLLIYKDLISLLGCASDHVASSEDSGGSFDSNWQVSRFDG